VSRSPYAADLLSVPDALPSVLKAAVATGHRRRPAAVRSAGPSSASRIGTLSELIDRRVWSVAIASPKKTPPPKS
jgi:hypothetical protein